MTTKPRTFAKWLSSLSDRTSGIRVEIGPKSQQGSTLGVLAIAGRELDVGDSAYLPVVVELSELATHVQEMCQDAGWPKEIPKMRLYALDKKGRAITSYQKTERPPAEAASKSDTVIMFEQMAEMMSRQLSTIERLVSTQSQSIENLSDANTHAMSTTIHMIDGMIESREYAADTAAANAYLETMLTEEGGNEENAFVGLAREALSSIGMASPPEEDHPEPPAEDIESIKRRMHEDLFFRRDLEEALRNEKGATNEENNDS